MWTEAVVDLSWYLYGANLPERGNRDLVVTRQQHGLRVSTITTTFKGDHPNWVKLFDILIGGSNG